MKPLRALTILFFALLVAACRSLPPVVETLPSPTPFVPAPATPTPFSPSTPVPAPTATPLILEMEILVHSDQTGNNQIYLLDCRSGELERLTESEADDCYASWSPDRERIAFTSDRDGNREIYLMNADGDDLERVTDNPGPDVFPVWSPDGQSLAFFSGRGGVDNLMLYTIETETFRPLTSYPEGTGGAIVFSPDGSRVFFGFDRMGRYKIYQLELTGGEPKEIITHALRNNRMTCLEDSGDLALLYVSGKAGQDDIWLSYVEDGRFLNITRDSAPDHSPALAPDGDGVVFSSQRGGENWQLYLVSRSGNPLENEVIRITNDGFNYWYPHVR